MSTVEAQLRELFAKVGDEQWELHDLDGGYLQIMGQPDGDADDQGRPQIIWPHIADIIDSGDYWAVGEMIVAAKNGVPLLLDTMTTIKLQRDTATNLLAELVGLFHDDTRSYVIEMVERATKLIGEVQS